jgi:urease accessory protein
LQSVEVFPILDKTMDPRDRFPLPVRARAALLALVLSLAAGLLSAHPGHPHPEWDIDEFDERIDSFVGGFAHPFGGLDHLVVALVAGALAATARGRRGLLLGAAFVGAFAAGLALGAPGAIAGVSAAATLTLLGLFALLGSFVLASVRPGLVGKGLLLAAMGFSQGAAHGLAGPSWTVGAGLLLGTTAVAAVGALAALPLRDACARLRGRLFGKSEGAEASP